MTERMQLGKKPEEAVSLSHLFLSPVVDIPGDTGLDVAVHLADVHLPQTTNKDQ
jgi:hypothetical protein